MSVIVVFLRPLGLRLAEAEVPRAMASALRDGKLGVLDYYDMKNVIADTQMRESISKVGDNQVPGKGKTIK